MKPLKLAEHKRAFLIESGFKQTYESEPKKVMNRTVLTAMEKWEKWDDVVPYHLYIHFDEEESAFCNLYVGEEGYEADVFSERNLISEMKKRLG